MGAPREDGLPRRQFKEMTSIPDVSVVMSVYNGAKYLSESIESILSQRGVALEFIVVDDGSTDESGRIVQEYSRKDDRVKYFHQGNQGLTKALIKGCDSAQGKYIARQDVGDISLPDRLIKQLDCINRNPGSAFVSCGTRFVGPQGEVLYDVIQDPAEATTRLLTLNLDEIRGPSSHPSTIFPRHLYKKAGGYRSAFYFAQDLDLWVRLAERGSHVVMPEVLYQASVTVGSISGLHRKEQIELTRIIFECARLRRDGLNEAHELEKARLIKPNPDQINGRLARAKALYFIGACLKNRRNPQASGYFKQALRVCPWHIKSALRLLLG